MITGINFSSVELSHFSVKMEKILWSARLYQYCGLGQPKSNSLLYKLFYNCYSYVIFSFTTAVFISKFVRLMNTEIKNVDELCTETHYLLETLNCVYIKGAFAYLQRHKLESLVAIFDKGCCKPKNEAEVEIVKKYEKQCRCVEFNTYFI